MYDEISNWSIHYFNTKIFIGMKDGWDVMKANTFIILQGFALFCTMFDKLRHLSKNVSTWWMGNINHIILCQHSSQNNTLAYIQYYVLNMTAGDKRKTCNIHQALIYFLTFFWFKNQNVQSKQFKSIKITPKSLRITTIILKGLQRINWMYFSHKSVLADSHSMYLSIQWKSELLTKFKSYLVTKLLWSCNIFLAPTLEPTLQNIAKHCKTQTIIKHDFKWWVITYSVSQDYASTCD